MVSFGCKYGNDVSNNLDGVDDVLGGEDGDTPGLDPNLDVLEHEHLDLSLDPHDG